MLLLYSYIILFDFGFFVFGIRLINWVWYCNFFEIFEINFVEFLMDINGYFYVNIVFFGFVWVEIWKFYLVYMFFLILGFFVEFFI